MGFIKQYFQDRKERKMKKINAQVVASYRRLVDYARLIAVSEGRPKRKRSIR